MGYKMNDAALKRLEKRAELGRLIEATIRSCRERQIVKELDIAIAIKHAILSRFEIRYKR